VIGGTFHFGGELVGRHSGLTRRSQIPVAVFVALEQNQVLEERAVFRQAQSTYEKPLVIA
jgi:hypothetical protein